ncbi:response regulator transcription factor [Acrocarpospora pleiomorpha]|uniref:response regulator transcription factor n=1 Tax=Acrocarpospora pleiomorpha TaxID=90975 RepID=UPI003CD06943
MASTTSVGWSVAGLAACASGAVAAVLIFYSEIAEHLHLTVGTVMTHIGRLLAKLYTRDRAQLVIAAYEGGLVTNPWSQ